MQVHITRRQAGRFMGAALAAVGSAGTARASSISKNAPFDFKDPHDRIAAYVKVRASLDGTPRIYHYHADCFGIPDGGAPRLLFRREGLSVHRMVINADRTAGLRYTECNYTLDNDGKPIESWINPFTNASMPVKNQAPSAGLKVLITPEGVTTPGVTLHPPSSSALLFSPPVVSGNRIWFTDDIMFFRTSADAANFQMAMARPGDIQLTELITFESALDDVQNPKLASAPATATIGAVVPWMPWMGMKTTDGKDIPGRMMLRYRCAKIRSAADLPAWLSARVEKDYPGFIADPKLEL
jgi:hypothetical protein